LKVAHVIDVAWGVEAFIGFLTNHGSGGSTVGEAWARARTSGLDFAITRSAVRIVHECQ
jgi:hypothetical protein